MSKPEWEAACNHTATCGLTGAASFFSSIPGSFVLVNGPLWCYFYAMKYVVDQDETAMGRFACTQPSPSSLYILPFSHSYSVFRSFSKQQDCLMLGFFDISCQKPQAGAICAYSKQNVVP